MTNNQSDIESLPADFFTVEDARNGCQYGPFKTMQEAADFTKAIGLSVGFDGTTISQCRDFRLVRSEVITNEEYEKQMRENPSEFLFAPEDHPKLREE
jgi:hypothetical protein